MRTPLLTEGFACFVLAVSEIVHHAVFPVIGVQTQGTMRTSCQPSRPYGCPSPEATNEGEEAY